MIGPSFDSRGIRTDGANHCSGRLEQIGPILVSLQSFCWASCANAPLSTFLNGGEGGNLFIRAEFGSDSDGSIAAKECGGGSEIINHIPAFPVCPLSRRCIALRIVTIALKCTRLRQCQRRLRSGLCGCTTLSALTFENARKRDLLRTGYAPSRTPSGGRLLATRNHICGSAAANRKRRPS